MKDQARFMALGPRLDLRQTQTLVMTPQLRQAIKLLQYSNIEVASFVEEELERNPLLERDDSAELPNTERAAPDQTAGAAQRRSIDAAQLAQADTLPRRDGRPARCRSQRDLSTPAASPMARRRVSAITGRGGARDFDSRRARHRRFRR